MNTPLVSILMPVYNSFDFVRSENNKLLPKALEAILAQTYKHFELIILDNQSTDDTGTVCKEYAKKDSRIRYIVDSEKRYPEGGITQAATFRKGEYTMIANDDDLWDPTYIEKMLAELEKHPEADMCYSNGTFVDISGSVIGPINTTDQFTYLPERSPISNVSTYLMKRNPIPLAFGLFRSEAYTKTLPFEDFDDLKANVDNVFVAKFFLLGLKCHYLDEKLFSYRRKQRTLVAKKVKGMPEDPLEIWLYYIEHQFNFYQKIETLFTLRKLTGNQLRHLQAVNLQSFLIYTHRLIHWIRDGVIKENDRAHAIAHSLTVTTERSIKKSVAHFPALGNFPTDEEDTVCFHPAVLEKMFAPAHASLLEFIAIVEQYHTLIPKESCSPLAKKVLDNLKAEAERIKTIMDEIIHDRSAHPTIVSNWEHVPGRPSEKPALSVISASMNLKRFLDDTIRSVANQKSAAIEHIIVDGASTDGSLETLEKYTHLRVISEKDHGYPDALRKGIRMARGRYVIQCAVSDCLASDLWAKKCIEVLDTHPEVSLVWGFPERFSEDGVPGNVSYVQFHHDLAPRKEQFFSYWMKTSFFFPEGNLCVRKEVLDQCYPSIDIIHKNQLDWLEFTYNFHSSGYLSYHLPVVANYGRTHGKQMGEDLTKSGKIWTMYRHYLREVTRFRWGVMLGIITPQFKDGDGKLLDIPFDRGLFIREYIQHRIQKGFRIDPKYLSLKKYKEYAKKRFHYAISKITTHP